MELREVFKCSVEEWTVTSDYGIKVHGDIPGKTPTRIVFDLEFPNMATAFRFIEEFGPDYIYSYDNNNAVNSVHEPVTLAIEFANPRVPF